jgi:hypothetical protein
MTNRISYAREPIESSIVHFTLVKRVSRIREEQPHCCVFRRSRRRSRLLLPSFRLRQAASTHRICLEFSEMPAAKFILLAWLMAEPLSQFCARRYILKPGIHFQFVFLDGSWPQSVNKKADSVINVD